MNSKYRFPLIVLVLALYGLDLLAQIQGQPFVTHIPFHAELGDPQVNFFAQDDEDMMLIGSSAGVMAYDGSTWDLIQVPSVPICGVFDSRNNRLIIGTKNGLCQFNVTDGGGYQLDTADFFPESIGQIDRIMVHGNGFLAIGIDRVVSIPVDQQANGFTFQDSTLRPGGAFVWNDQIHLLHTNGDHSVLGSKGPEQTKSSAMTTTASVRFTVSSPSGVFIGLSDDSIWKYSDGKIDKIDGEVAEFASRYILSDAAVISENMLVLSTLAGGIVIAETTSLKIIHRFNHATGFPDNEVIALGQDKNGGAWMAHQSGISRVDIAQPISVLSGFPGLEGDVICSIVHKDKLYVGTGFGLYELTKTTDRKEVEEVIKLEQRGSDFGPDLNLVPKLRNQTSVGQNRQGAGPVNAGGIVGNSSRTGNLLPPGAQIPGMKLSTSQPAQPRVAVKKTEPKLVERTIFRRVKNLNVKVRSLVNFKGHLMAVTNNGLYLINEGTAKNLTPDKYILSVFPSEGELLVSTSSGLSSLTGDGKNWTLTPTHDLKDLAFSIYKDSEGVWVGSENKVVLLSESGDQKEILLDLSGSQRVSVVGIYDKAHFLTSDGVFHYSSATDTVMKAGLPGITDEARYRHLVGNDDEVWIKDESGWQIMNNDAHVPLLPFLELFNDVAGISSDDAGNLYVVDKKTGLFRISNALVESDPSKFKVYIKHAKASTGHLFELGKMVLDPDRSSVSVQLSAPFYLKNSSSEFQYRLDGLKGSDWGNWTTESRVEIPFLPAGDYTLEVRARSVFGEISDVQRLSFKIEPVFWLRWYMILNYLVVGLILILFVINLRERSLRSDQRKLEEMVQDRTAALEQEKEKVEDLLLNILPRETAQELKTKGKATAKQYNSASVLFTDFKDFTRLTTNVSAEELVNELDRYFIRFDEICQKYGLEKIKTIGDSYMCASGIPAPSRTHALAITLAGLEMCEYMNEVALSKKEQDLTPWEIRVGIHSGPLTAGVVGKNKFAYDIWGDTVNAASRMESASEPGKINVSLITYGMIRQYFNCSPRGKVEVKGKGEMEMFFVNGLKPEYLSDGQPNSSNLDLLGRRQLLNNN